MIKIGFKSLLFSFGLTAGINFIYGVENLGVNIGINIILVALSFTALILEDKNNEKLRLNIENEKVQKENIFKESILASLNNRDELNKIGDLLEEIVSLNNKMVKSSNELNNKNEEILIAVTKVKEEIKNSTLEFTNLNNNKSKEIIDLLKNLDIKMEEKIKEVANTKNLISEGINTLSNDISKMNDELNENKHLINIVKASNRIDKNINKVADDLEDMSSDLEDNIQILNSNITDHKKKNDRNMSDVLDLIEKLSETLQSQQGHYKEVNDNVLEKIKAVTEVNTRNVKLLKDSYNTLDKIVNNIA